MSLILHKAKGYDEYKEKLYNLMTNHSNEPLCCWYIGAKSGGQSWCGDCRDSEPIITDYLNSLKLTKNVNVICAEVERDDFRSPECKFRSEDPVGLLKVPTLFNPSLQKKLVERDCMDKSKLDLFFSDLKQSN